MAGTTPDTRTAADRTGVHMGDANGGDGGNRHAPHPPNMPLLYVGLAAGVALAIALVALFPNLLGSPPNLALVVLSPILGGLVVGLLVSRAGRRLPGRTEDALRVAFLLLLLLDAWVYLGPLVVRGGTAHDTAPAFNPPVAVSTRTATPAPRALTGRFDHKNNPAHSVSGTATLGATSDGKLVLQFSDFNSTNGPDLYVYLSREASPTQPAQVMNGLEVSKLKATQTAPGAVSAYELPAGTDIAQFKSAVVYCKAFSAIFGFANLG